MQIARAGDESGKREAGANGAPRGALESPESISSRRSGRVPAFGALSAVAKDNVYWFGDRGLIFTSPWVVTPRTERQTAVVLLTARRDPLELSVGDRLMRDQAFAIAPQTRRGLRAVDAGLVSINVEPHHPSYAAFRRAGCGVRALSRAAFGGFDTALERAYEGELPHAEAEELFEGVVEMAVRQIEGEIRRDERAEQLHAMLRENPDCSLGDVARELKVSYTGASHAFARAVGLPLRSYQHWMKCMRASSLLGRDVKLTEIARVAGFADSSHLSRSWQRQYGLPPSYIRDDAHVRIVY